MKPNLRKQKRLTVLALLVLMLMLAAFGVKAQPTRELTQEEQADGKNESRTALVIGNGSYPASPLKNPVNDATDMAAALKSLGFEVLAYTNLDQNAMKKAIRAFGAKLRTKGGVGLFYYAGHGMQVKGENFLIPVSANVGSEEEVEYEAIEVGLVIAQMEAAKNSMNIVILDACRNNPFARSFRSADKGLAQISAPAGTLIAYSTSPNSVASDGAGRNGLYTQEFLKAVKKGGMSIEDIFKTVRVSVRAATEGKQTPWESSSLTGSFYFTGGGGANENKANTADGETAFWRSIENSDDPKDFESFLKQYPRSVYAPVAQNKLRKLNPATDKREKKTDPTVPVKPVSVGVVNSRAISLVKPRYPAEAKAAQASGAVSVQVTIDENGNVISASAVSGHALLREAAVAAASASKFSPIMIDGKAVRVTGTVIYNFIP
jgi:TonB family protein